MRAQFPQLQLSMLLLCLVASVPNSMSRRTSISVPQLTGLLPCPLSHSWRTSVLIRRESLPCLCSMLLTFAPVGLASNPGAEEGEKSAWYPLFAHALNYYIKPRGFMQMTSQNYPSVNNDSQRNHEDMIVALTLTFGTWSVISAMRDETTMTTLSSRASFTSSNTNGITQ